MAENSGQVISPESEEATSSRIAHECPACGEITWRKADELPPEHCYLCGAIMFERPIYLKWRKVKLADHSANVVRARIGLGLEEDVTGKKSITVVGMTLYGYEDSGEKVLGVDKFSATAPIEYVHDTDNNRLVIVESVKFLAEFFTKFDDPLALSTLDNQTANEIIRGIDPTGNTHIMDAIRAGGAAPYKIRKV